jgi:C4-dicarboxylate-specific signal transduction histidine kinase
MAGAIAHEVNQPLTALINYGRSGQLLIASGRQAELTQLIEKMLAEAQRAADVVRRLRDFFREGSTRLEKVPAAALLDSGQQVGASMKRGLNIAITARCAAELPDVLVDKLQIELVLRNLVANAVEAIAAEPRSDGRVELTAERHDAQHLRIVVSDNGPGITAETRERLFEPFVSGKPTGMGLGLAVSRAIAEAHGGTLENRSGAHGEFHLVLPFEQHGQA